MLPLYRLFLDVVVRCSYVTADPTRAVRNPPKHLPSFRLHSHIASNSGLDSMAPPQSPSIQSFFQPETPSTQPAVAVQEEDGNECTTTEVKAFLYSTPHAWKPRIQYEDIQIGKLAPRPRCVHLVARVVNFYDPPTSTSNLPHPAKRCLNVLVRDDTGMIKVRHLPVSLLD